MRFSAFNAQVNWLQNVGSGILNFWPENYLEPPKVKKKLKNFFWLWKALKNLGGKNSKFRFQRLVANLVVWIMPQIASRYLENCRGEILREPLKFSQKLEATLQTGNSTDFQNILNRPSNRSLWWGYELFGDYLNFLKKSYWWGGHLKFHNL